MTLTSLTPPRKVHLRFVSVQVAPFPDCGVGLRLLGKAKQDRPLSAEGVSPASVVLDTSFPHHNPINFLIPGDFYKTWYYYDFIFPTHWTY